MVICSWLYRIRPSVVHCPFKRIENKSLTNKFTDFEPNPNQLRWKPFPFPEKSGVDFIDVC